LGVYCVDLGKDDEGEGEERGIRGSMSQNTLPFTTNTHPILSHPFPTPLFFLVACPSNFPSAFLFLFCVHLQPAEVGILVCFLDFFPSCFSSSVFSKSVIYSTIPIHALNLSICPLPSSSCSSLRQLKSRRGAGGKKEQKD
jgi:hypothetical protein